MTLTTDIPEDLVVKAATNTLAPDEVTRIVAAVAAATPNTRPRLHSVLEFAGVGAGRPGSIGDDVQGYIDAMRDEWEEGEAALDWPGRSGQK